MSRRLLLAVSILSVVAHPAAQASCLHDTRQQLSSDGVRIWQGVRHAPRNALKTDNLKWELPIAAASGILISSVDIPASARARSQDVADSSGRASNVLLGTFIAGTGLTFTIGCAGGKSHARRAGWAAMEALGYGIGFDLALKAAFNRQYPYAHNGRGEFWTGGKSFPSGHAAASWAVASALAHQYPRNRWVKVAAYAAATGVSLLRFPAKKHFPSDILVGATLGYVIGARLGLP